MTNKQVFYEKVGRRYVATREKDIPWSTMPRGTHLTVCRPDGHTRYYNVDPAHAAVMAAMMMVSVDISDAIREKSKFTTETDQLTQAQHVAWKALEDAFGDHAFRLTTTSTHDCVQSGMKILEAKINELMNTPSVRLAYEQFLLVAALTKENNHDKL